jgi:elongation factor Tu
MCSINMQGRDPQLGAEAIKKLLDAVDAHIPEPVRELDKPFYLPIEQIYTIAGRLLQCQLVC